MKFVRFAAEGVEREGLLEGEEVVSNGMRAPLASVRLLAPCRPSKIVCVGRNYVEHLKEMDSDLPDHPLLFFKPPSAVLDPDGDIVYPPQSARVDYEGELGVVIGRQCHRVACRDALSYVRGYTIFNDVTARDLQETDGQWARAKGFDTFAPCGPCIADDVDPSRLRIRTLLNDEVRQDSSTTKMIFDVPTLIEFISTAFTLEPGDIIATGTPSGVGPMRPGDTVRVEIEGIGALVSRVVAAE